MKNVAELKEWISAHFWDSTQIAKWVEATFFRKKVHQQTSSGTPSGNLPIVTLSTGKIDLSFLSGTALAEYIADTVGAMFSGNTETNVTVTYQDSDNTIDVVVTTNTEEVQDIVGTMATDSSSIDFSYNDTAGTFTASVITEAIQDIVGAMGFSSGVNPVVYDGYDDASGTYTWSLQTNSITTAYLVDANVTLAKLADLAQATIVGRASAAGTGVPVALTADQLMAILNTSTTAFQPSNIIMDASGTITLASGGLAFTGAGDDSLTRYDIGTWTPVFADAISGGNTATVGTNNGWYVRVGNFVFAAARSVDITTTGMTGANLLAIRGLPFTSSNQTNYVSSGTVQVSNVAFSSYLIAAIGQNATFCRLVEHTTGAAATNTTVSDLTSGTADIFFTILYEVD